MKTDEAVYGKGAKKKVAEGDALAEHLVRKAMGIEALNNPCLKELERNEQTELFYELELPLALILAKMEYTGIKVDVGRLEEMKTEMAERLNGSKQKFMSSLVKSLISILRNNLASFCLKILVYRLLRKQKQAIRLQLMYWKS